MIGIGDDPVLVRKRVVANIQPWFEKSDESKLQVEFWVLPKTSKWGPVLPDIDVPSEKIVENLKPNMADPTFWRAEGVSVLLGIEVWAAIINGTSHRLGERLVSQESVLGNLIFGRIGESEFHTTAEPTTAKVVCSMSMKELDEKIQRFWQFEDLLLCEQENPEHAMVEEDFKKRHYRDSDGKFVVAIPMKPMVTEIGSQLYDPNGLIAPFIARAKMLMQSIWKEQLAWDQTVPDHISKQWKTLWSKIKSQEVIFMRVSPMKMVKSIVFWLIPSRELRL